jgi:hypothetical protein
MEKHSILRKIIVFSLFFVALVIIAPTIVFYSMGYRFNKESNEVIRSGSIVMKATPSSPEISLDGKKIDQASIDLINRSLNINGLEAKDYQVEVSAAGYYPWKKSVEVSSGIATEFWNIMLVPEKVAPKTINEDNIAKYAYSADKKKIAYFFSKDNAISLLIHENDLGEDFPVYSEALNQRYSPQPGELKWSSDGQWLLFSLKKNDTEEIWLTSAANNYAELIPVGTAWQNTLAGSINQTASKEKKKGSNSAINSYFWGDKNNLYFVTGNILYYQSAADLLNWWSNENNQNSNSSNVNSETTKKNSKNTNNLILPTDSQPVKIKENVYGLTACGSYLCSVNAPARNLEVSNNNGDLSQSVSFPDNYQLTDKYQIFAYADNRVAILDSNANLFVWDEDQNKKEEKTGLNFIFPGVSEVYFSNDGKKLLFSTKNEAYVYFVRDWDVQPRHTAGDLEVIYRDPQELKKVQWYLDYQNILVADNEGVKMVELDGRGGRNSADFVKGSNLSDVSYDTNTKKLWYLEDEGNGMKKLQEIAFPETTSLFSGIIPSGNNSQ